MTQPKGNAFSNANEDERRLALDARIRSVFTLMGCGLSISALFDVIAIFSGADFGNPAWEFQLMGDLVERLPVPLMGMGLIYFGEVGQRGRRWVKILPWASLLAGALFLLLIPLGLSATKRLNDQQNLQISTQVKQSLDQIDTRRTQLNKVKPEDLDRAFAVLSRQGKLPGVQNAQKLKSTLFTELANAETQVQKNADETRNRFKNTLVRNAVKWSFGALVGGIVFILFWRITTQPLDKTPRRPTRSGERLTAEQVAASLEADKKATDGDGGAASSAS